MARENDRAIIFIDEIDSMCGSRSEGENDSARFVCIMSLEKPASSSSAMYIFYLTISYLGCAYLLPFVLLDG